MSKRFSRHSKKAFILGSKSPHSAFCIGSQHWCSSGDESLLKLDERHFQATDRSMPAAYLAHAAEAVYRWLKHDMSRKDVVYTTLRCSDEVRACVWQVATAVRKLRNTRGSRSEAESRRHPASPHHFIMARQPALPKHKCFVATRINSTALLGRSEVGGAAYLVEIGYAVSALSRTPCNKVQKLDRYL